MSNLASAFPFIKITPEMLKEANALIGRVRVNRTVASRIDTLTGILGEFIFAQYFWGDWRRHRVGKNKGETDFPDIEIKTSAFPFNRNLHLLVREDYARKRKPPFYVQIIIDIDDSQGREIPAGARAYLCGFATAQDIDAAPKKDFGSKISDSGGYQCHYIPIGKLKPMIKFRQAHQIYRQPELIRTTNFAGSEVFYRGNLHLPDMNPIALFCSRRVPKALAEQAVEFGECLWKQKLTIAGGWQSEVEREILQRFTSQSRSNIIFFPASGIRDFKPPGIFTEEAFRRRYLIISPWSEAIRPDMRKARQRNQLILSSIDRLLFLGITKGGSLDELFNWAQLKGKTIFVLDYPANALWIEKGGIPVSADTYSQLIL